MRRTLQHEEKDRLNYFQIRALFQIKKCFFLSLCWWYGWPGSRPYRSEMSMRGSACPCTMLRWVTDAVIISRGPTCAFYLARGISLPIHRCEPVYVWRNDEAAAMQLDINEWNKWPICLPVHTLLSDPYCEVSRLCWGVWLNIPGRHHTLGTNPPPHWKTENQTPTCDGSMIGSRTI